MVGGVRTAPSLTRKMFDIAHSASSPRWFFIRASAAPRLRASWMARALFRRLFDLISGLTESGWLRTTDTRAIFTPSA